jgi:hypothetical protein
VIFCGPFHTIQSITLAPPYVSAYQLAIAFAEEYPDAAASLGYSVGGEGTGEYNSIAKYLAHELSVRIKQETLNDIEGAWLSRQYLPGIDFIDDEDQSRAASMNPKGLSLFRLHE